MRILVVDDDRAVRESLRRSLAFNGYQVELATDGYEALDAVARQRPDAMVLDVMMPRLDGLEVCRRLRGNGDGLPIIVLTARDAVADRVAGLDAGADDYLVKPFSFSELLARLRALLRRPVLQTANRLAVGGIAMDLAARAVTRGSQEVVLTPREFAVLEYLLRHPGQALSRTQIAERVWSWEFHGDSNIVDVYIGYLRRKLDTAGEPSAIETLRGFGYRLRGEARDG
jgi:two-component system, OmpR family, response regulator MprA